ncbi:hypothetical protein DFJ74DRAFT_708038 [Hyaloraphidium curvatum]|nr:hypothetical protein DFJ74DRAFT_708038 [Hyaloraphidium curvatum]
MSPATRPVDSIPPREDAERDLRDASRRGDLALLRTLLLRTDVDPDARDREGWTALMSACFFGHDRVVGRLLEDGRADPNARAPDGQTPLRLAVGGKWKHVVEALAADPRTIVDLPVGTPEDLRLAAEAGLARRQPAAEPA